MDISDFVKDNEDLVFLNEISLALSDSFLNEVHLVYKGKRIYIEPIRTNIVVFFEGKEEKFNNVNELFFNFILDGKPFIERVSDIDYL